MERNKLSLRLPPELRRELEREAAADRRPVSSLVRNILEDHVMQLNPHHVWQHFEGRDTAGARKLRKLRAAAAASAHGSIAIREYDEAHSAAAANPAQFERHAEFEELGT